MSKSFQSHMSNNHTSAFTLPTPRKERCEEFSTSCNQQSPSLPWLVEYWSSSFFRGPELFFDHLCSRSSATEID